MARKLKPRRLRQAEPDRDDSIKGFAHTLFLAGLGATAKAIEEGPRLFSRLVEEGKQTITGRADEKPSTPLRTRKPSAEDLEAIEQIFIERLARVLDKLDVPLENDLRELSNRLAALEQKIKPLLGQMKKTSSL